MYFCRKKLKMKKFIFTMCVLLTCGVTDAMAQMRVRFNNETADTIVLTSILMDLEQMRGADSETLVAEAGKRFLGKPYKGGTLESDEKEMLTVNTDELDCTTFVETALALAMTAESRRSSWHDFVWNLTRLRYRGGEVDGYPSRLHYISDWIVDNTHKDIILEVTDRIANASYQVKTLDYMSSHKDAYKALADSAALAGIKNVEVGYRSHRYPYIRSANVKNVSLREGDVIAITTGTKGLDVSHMGIVVMVDGVPHLMHASSKEGKVVVDKLSLADYLRRTRAQGIRVIRLKD